MRGSGIWALPFSGNVFVEGSEVSTIATDMTLIRNIRVADGKTVQLRLEAFNLFNTTNFNLPNANVFVQGPGGAGTINATAGQITSALAPRQLQLALRFNF